MEAQQRVPRQTGGDAGQVSACQASSGLGTRRSAQAFAARSTSRQRVRLTLADSEEIGEPDSVQGDRPGDVQRRVPGQSVAWKIWRRVDEHVDAGGQHQRDTLAMVAAPDGDDRSRSRRPRRMPSRSPGRRAAVPAAILVPAAPPARSRRASARLSGCQIARKRHSTSNQPPSLVFAAVASASTCQRSIT